MAGLTGVGFTAVSAGPASAAVQSGICLDANAGETYDFGAITQYSCNIDDPYQSWTLNPVTNTPYGTSYQLLNDGAALIKGAGDCLDANAQQVYDGGQIMQWACNPQDPYQQWIFLNDNQGSYILMNYGDILYNPLAMCLDAYKGQEYDGGKVIQYTCNGSDSFQQWTLQPSAYGLEPFATGGYQLQLNY
jgi:hypothetical protein